MKTAPPAHPHHATPLVMIDTAGKYHVRIDVSLEVPSRVAAHLPEHSDGAHHIISAGMGDERHLACRARAWKRTGADHLRAAIAEGCDTVIFIRTTAEEWHLIGRLCGKLNITPGQWLLSCAAYNADIAERDLDRQLAAIPEQAETEQPR